LFGGRTLANRGIPNSGNYFNCFSSGFIPDDYTAIMDRLKEVGITFKAQGGQGVSMSKLRPKGTPIGEHYSSDGIIPFIEMFNCVTKGTSQGGSRKGALMISLDARHKEVMDFINLKTDVDAITKANLSLEIDDTFMSAVSDYYENGTVKTLHEKREYSGHTVEYDIIPINIYKRMMEIVWDYGEPGCIFTNKFRNYNFLEYDDEYQIDTSNPCLHEDTLIQTTEGLVKIKDMHHPMMVYCMDNDHRLTIRQASPSFKTGHFSTIKFTLNDGSSIQMTDNHLVYIEGRGWIQAKDINIGDSPIVLLRNRRGAKYSGVRLSSMARDLTVMEHRLVYEAYNGKIADNEDIHHIDGDTYNNNYSNLAKLSHSEHATLTRYSCPNDHQVQDENTGRFISPSTSKHGAKDVLEMPEHLKTNFKSKPRIVKIENGEVADVYDIMVEEFHNFVAGGMIVHNCGEQPLKSKACCNLGSLNLYEFVIYPFTNRARFDFDTFDEAIRIASNALDNIIDENAERLPKEMREYAENARNWRNIGLGVFGYADALIALGLIYGSAEALHFTNNLFDFMMTKAIHWNQVRAQQKDMYPKFKDDSVYKSAIFKLHDKEAFTDYKFRNCSLLSIAPTGSIGTMMGLSGGIEPEFALSYTRRTDNLNEEYKIEAKVVNDYRKITHDNSEELPRYFVTSAEIPWKSRVDTQSTIQSHIDTAISSTVNLPKETTKEEIEQLYLYAWKRGLKGITIFRDGCKRLGILTTQDNEDSNGEERVKIDDLRRGDILKVSDDLIGYKRKIVNGCGDFMEQIFFDEFSGEPMENYIAMGDNGGCEKNMEAISRLISLCWRSGVMVDEVVKQLKKVRTCPAYRTRHLMKGDTSKGTSCPSALGFAIEELCSKIHDRCFEDDYSDEDNDIDFDEIEYSSPTNTMKAKCPECGAEISFEGGCAICHECGWSKCE
jgi:ribonucleotide reductase alpha subunit